MFPKAGLFGQLFYRRGSGYRDREAEQKGNLTLPDTDTITLRYTFAGSLPERNRSFGRGGFFGARHIEHHGAFDEDQDKYRRSGDEVHLFRKLFGITENG